MHISQLLLGASLVGSGLGLTASTCNGKWVGLLNKCLSPKTTLQCGNPKNPRWSDYASPQPGSIVTIGDEGDVAKVISALSKTNTPFLVQSGANGWANTFKIGSSGVVIDISNLKTISFSKDKSQVTFQAGVTNEDMINAAWSNNARVSVSTCNCVSLLGATLGGGLSRTQGVYGHNIDQLISLNIVDPNGNRKTVTKKSNSELWWALTGAGANFGVVTSATYKSQPIPQAQNTAWTGLVLFNSSQIEQLVTAIDQLTLQPDMQMDFYFTASPIDGKPAVLFLPFYLGSEAVGRQKFASIFKIGPVLDTTDVIPYNTWNTAGDPFCTVGGRKPSYTVGLKNMDPKAWRNVWNEYTAFFNKYPEANLTTILTECYPTASSAKSVQSDGSTSYPFRGIKCHAIAIPWYTSPSIDATAVAWGQKIRSYWTASAGTSPSSYINFAHGDEPLSQIYGSSLNRLKQLKGKYDPQKRLNQWFPLS
ncbi:FAD binding domain-containing protein [Nemania sp. FL0916]|nr:FAD binding domain-containing protein [Nemania sp. FL0916]